MAFRVRTISPDDPPDTFPDPAAAGIALGYPDGLLAIGGDLGTERLLTAYRRGIFPWYNDDQPILWWSPEPRAVIFPCRLHMSRSLRRELRRRDWHYSVNQAFEAVIDGCAQNRGEHGTWITAEMRTAFLRMHELGYAHSVESWLDGKLAGGVYGIRLGSIFFGESMFSARRWGSKVALSALAHLCLEEGIRIIDCQLESDHLRTLGMQTLHRDEFLERLPGWTENEAPLPDWQLTPRSARDLGAAAQGLTC